MQVIFKGRPIQILSPSEILAVNQIPQSIEQYFYTKKGRSSNPAEFKDSLFLNYLYVSLVRDYIISNYANEIPRDKLQTLSKDYLEKLKRGELRGIKEKINPDLIQSTYINYFKDPMDVFYQLSFTNFSNDYIMNALERVGLFTKGFIQTEQDAFEIMAIHDELFLPIFNQAFEKFERKNGTGIFNFNTSTNTTSNKNTSKKKEGCYIATAVYGDYEAPEVLTLRKFRDESLKKYYLGNQFIKFYYKYSPTLVKKMEGKAKINQVVKSILDRIVNYLNK